MRNELQAPAELGLLEYVESLSDTRERERAMAVIHRHEMAGANLATWMPGAEETIRELYRADIPIGIVTRNSRAAARLTMQRLRMPPMPLKSREDAAPKPNPEALLAIANTWNIAPHDCAYIGDYHYDTQAASRAGMQAVLYVEEGSNMAPSHDDVIVLRDFHSLLSWVS
ncbi:MAG: hypothetical protein Cons2KO_10800 [Congregibacter sp.]